MQYNSTELATYLDTLRSIKKLLEQNSNSETLDKLQKIMEYLEFISSTYERVEGNLKNTLSRYFQTVYIGTGPAKGTFLIKIKEKKNTYHNLRVYKHTSYRRNKSVASYLRNGICVGRKITYSLFSTSSSHKAGIFGLSSNLEILKGSASGDIGITLYDKNGKFYPNVYADVNAKLSLLESSVNASVGNSKLGATATADIEVGAVYAISRAKIGSDGIDIEAKVGAHLGKVGGSAGIHLFGYYLEVEASAILGGASAGFEYQRSNKEITVGVEGSLFAGLGIKLKFGKGEE